MRQRSWNFSSLFMAYLCLGGLVAGCQSLGKNSQNSGGATSERPLVDEKYSLTADRNEFEALRKDIPEEKRVENDELALLKSLFGDETKNPSQVREKFDSLLRKKRELFQKDMTKKREVYTKEERKRREAFNKEQDKARNEFKKRKSTHEERNEFFGELDSKRRDFLAEERSKRDDFEEEMRDQRKNFDDYARSKSSEFQQEHRAYTLKFQELQKQKEKEKKAP